MKKILTMTFGWIILAGLFAFSYFFQKIALATFITIFTAHTILHLNDGNKKG